MKLPGWPFCRKIPQEKLLLDGNPSTDFPCPNNQVTHQVYFYFKRHKTAEMNILAASSSFPTHEQPYGAIRSMTQVNILVCYPVVFLLLKSKLDIPTGIFECVQRVCDIGILVYQVNSIVHLMFVECELFEQQSRQGVFQFAIKTSANRGPRRNPMATSFFERKSSPLN